MVLRKGRETLVEQKILSETCQLDTMNFPTFDKSDPLKNTTRELTFNLLKQRDFLLQRVLVLVDLNLKNPICKMLHLSIGYRKSLDIEDSARQGVPRSFRVQPEFGQPASWPVA